MVIHILNGDSLRHQLPVEYKPVIVFRECLIDGPVNSVNESEFWKARKDFLKDECETHNIDYLVSSKHEIEKTKEIPEDYEICLWFEYDLFCQINMWFITHYIQSHISNRNISWVAPDHCSWTGFGQMSASSLRHAYASRIPISNNELGQFADMWKNYQAAQYQLIENSRLVGYQKFSKLANTVKALVEMHPISGDSSIVCILKSIINEYPNMEFGEVFRLFSEKAGIYGLGDTQVKRIWDNQVKN